MKGEQYTTKEIETENQMLDASDNLSDGLARRKAKETNSKISNHIRTLKGGK